MSSEIHPKFASGGKLGSNLALYQCISVVVVVTSINHPLLEAKPDLHQLLYHNPTRSDIVSA